jgi:GNAT superfamily N-acetyltransferase
MKSLQISCTDDVIEMWLQRSQLLIDAHSNAVIYYRVLHYFFGVLIIVLSGVMTFPCIQIYIPYFSSLIVIIASIYVFLGFNYTAEQHRHAAKSYGEIMRALETQKSFISDVSILKTIEEKINRTNAEAPDIPLSIFRKREKVMLEYVDQIEQEKQRSLPKLVSNVSFSSHPSVTESQLSEEHYKLEIEYFGKYAACPATFDEFKKKYEHKSLILTDARIDGNLVGYCVFERIKGDLCHLVIVIVSPSYRHQGLGKRLVSSVCEELTAQGIRQFSLFTADDPTIRRLFRGIADPVSVESDLTTDEIKALGEIARYRGLSESEYGKSRTIEKYYTLRDGCTLDATFRLYKL